MPTEQCFLRLKAICEDQNCIFCELDNRWLHANCENLINEEFEVLCNVNNFTSWYCTQCSLRALPFQKCSKKVFILLFANDAKNKHKNFLERNLLNKLFFNNENTKPIQSFYDNNNHTNDAV